MRSHFSLLALLLGAATVHAQGTATVEQTTSLFDASTLRGTQALYVGTGLNVSACVQHGPRAYYVAQIAETGYRGLVPVQHVRWSSGRRMPCAPAARAAEAPLPLVYAPGRVTLYSGPSASARVVATLAPGDVVRVASCETGWCSVYSSQSTEGADAARLGYAAAGMLLPQKKSL